jgi:hypothetical protein
MKEERKTTANKKKERKKLRIQTWTVADNRGIGFWVHSEDGGIA